MAGRRAFLLVESPPFHSILHGEPRAFYEQSPRVWVELGWRHPRAESVEASACEPNRSASSKLAPSRYCSVIVVASASACFLNPPP